MHDDYPGQEKVLLIIVRVLLAALVGVVLGATFVAMVVDPAALLIAGVAVLCLIELREF